MSEIHQTWSQLITTLKAHENCSLYYRKWILISDLHSWTQTQDDYMQHLLSKGINPKQYPEASERKEILIEVSSMLKANKHEQLGSITGIKFSIYPILK